MPLQHHWSVHPGLLGLLVIICCPLPPTTAHRFASPLSSPTAELRSARRPPTSCCRPPLAPGRLTPHPPRRPLHLGWPVGHHLPDAIHHRHPAGESTLSAGGCILFGPAGLPAITPYCRSPSAPGWSTHPPCRPLHLGRLASHCFPTAV